jgi:hypothetical protein
MKQVAHIMILIASLSLSLTTFAANDSHGEEKAYRNLLPQPKAIKALATPPKKVELKSPEALSKVTGSNVLLEWVPSEGAETYHIQIAKDPAFKWIIQEDHFVKATSFQAVNLPKGQVFWRVAASRPGNMAAHWKSIFTSSSFEIVE